MNTDSGNASISEYEFELVYSYTTHILSDIEALPESVFIEHATIY